VRSLFIACLLFVSVDAWTQPEARVYYNRFEWTGVAGGYQVNRWRYELSASWHQKEFVGLYSQWYQESPTNAVTVFEDDVWRKRTSTLTGRVIRSGKKPRPWFGLYYGAYLRYIHEPSKLMEPHWGTEEEEVIAKFGAITSSTYNDICFGVLLGARGTIVKNVFWDANLALLPAWYSTRKQHYTDGSEFVFKDFLFTYLADDYTGHVLQIGIGYKFAMPEKE